MTIRLYEENPDLHEFSAEILRIEQSADCCQVILDRTAFFPEGGGQPADRGTIANIPVIDVQTRDREIIHFLKKEPPFEAGTSVSCKVNEKHRFDFMQQHTGQHLISAAFWKTAALKTVSVHMGADITTIEFDTPEISQTQLDEASELADRLIRDNLPITIHEVEPADLIKFPLRKPAPVNGRVRLVCLGNFDCVGCCGLHLKSTGRIRVCVCTGQEKIRGRIRTSWKIGDRAAAELNTQNRILSGLRTILGTRNDQLAASVNKQSATISRLHRENQQLENQLAVHLAEKVLGQAEIVPASDVPMVSAIFDHVSPGIMKSVVKILVSQKKLAFVIASPSGERLLWNAGITAGPELDPVELRNSLLKNFSASGGGRAPLWQGSMPDLSRTDEFVRAFKEFLADRLRPHSLRQKPGDP